MNKFLIVTSLTIQMAFGAEVDSFTRRNESFIDSSTYINKFANEALISATSKVEQNCNTEQAKKELYEQLTKYFANHTKGKLVKDLLHGEEIDRKITPLRESIYGKWKPLDGLRLGSRSAHKREFPLSPLIRVGDRLIGIDKLEHMFGMGQRYFKKHYLKKKDLKKVLKSGIIGEKFILGGQFLATGVFSFADLSANFNGMRFWNHMLQENPDILGAKYNYGPYILCENNTFKVNPQKSIDFRNYIDASVDESINCPKFARKTAVKKYTQALEELNMKCPLVDSELEDIKQKYSVIIKSDKKKRPISHWIINDEIVEDVSYFNEF
ncbi:hypothetical protein [Halobacteriovorax sp. HLS]|uniref:hypothetical protein n=1 Tax=Halobacteriovorax sp. HLS TaxID=2234000 RepID=UPI000FD6FEF3|nr:hypothetical protein [Halobacteriovorax sp. HLS]